MLKHEEMVCIERLAAKDDKLQKERLDSALHMYEYEDMLAGLTIATLQFTVALITEVVNMLVITGQKTVIDAIMNFVALKVIADIDDIYFSSLSNPILTKLVEGTDED